MLKLTRIDNLRAMSACTPTPEVSLQRGEPPLRANKRHPLTVAVGAIFEGAFVLVWLVA